MSQPVITDQDKFGDNTDVVNYVADNAALKLSTAVLEYALMPRVLAYLKAWPGDDDEARNALYQAMSSSEQHAASGAIQGIRILMGRDFMVRTSSIAGT